MNDKEKQFVKKVKNYYKRYRRSFPWRDTRDPYEIFISEIMLQQTQTDWVMKKYDFFLKRFPNVKALARASLKNVLAAWSGLGYNRRAKMLRDAAKILVQKHGGKIPRTEKELIALPGVGKGTAGAIQAFAFSEPAVFIETNIRAAFIHEFFGRKKIVLDNEIMPLIEETLDRKNPREWYCALMDYGAMLKKTRPNPNKKSAHYVRQSPFEGSDRRIRGLILRRLLESPAALGEISTHAGENKNRTEKILKKMLHEGLVKRSGRIFRV